jgi:ketosteroid isomerase-like protein
VPERISPEDVRAAVRRFWTILCGKSKEKFAEMYLPSASVFSSTASRTEPGRLMVARRIRKFFDSSTSLNAELGTIEVQILGENTAIATYVHAIQATETRSDGSHSRSTTPFARATHIFQRDEHGDLRIVHEHLSSATAPIIETVAQKK